MSLQKHKRIFWSLRIDEAITSLVVIAFLFFENRSFYLYENNVTE